KFGWLEILMSESYEELLNSKNCLNHSASYKEAMNEFRHVPRGTKKAAKKTPVEPGLFWRKRKLEIQIRYRQCVGFDEVSARFYRIAHQRIENLIGRDRIFDGHLKHPAYRRIHGGFPELIGVHFAESLVALHAMAACTFGHQPIERLLEGGHRLPALPSLDVGTLFQTTVELLTQHGNGSIVVTAEEIAVEGDVAGPPVRQDFYLRQPDLALLVFAQARFISQPRTLGILQYRSV